MSSFVQKQRQWLLPAILILFILLVVTFPFVTQLTYSGRSESPEHVLTYTTGELAWDNATEVNADGAAELTLFSAEYDNVLSLNGDSVVAPGTSSSDIIRLKNDAGGPVTYTATVYSIRSSDSLPIDVSLSGKNFTDTETAVLPEGVSADTVIRSVTGTVASGTIQDFDINWQWIFTEGAVQDTADSELGNNAAAGNPEDITVGIYIVVEDDNKIVEPEIPETGDSSTMGIYIALIAISGFVMILLLFGKRREEDEEEGSTCKS